MRRILKNTPDEKLKSVDEDFSNVVWNFSNVVQMIQI